MQSSSLELVAASGMAWSTACWLVQRERGLPGAAGRRGAAGLVALCVVSALSWYQARPAVAAVVEGILCQGAMAVVVSALATFRLPWVARSGYASAGVGGSALLWSWLRGACAL